VAYDVGLADRIRNQIIDDSDLREKKMFGGLAFLVGGNMAVAVSGQGGIMIRVEKSQTASLIATTAAQPFEMQGRPANGWLRVGAEDLVTEEQLSEWVNIGVDYARSLPAK
jgi:TfoX N-terminal domain